MTMPDQSLKEKIGERIADEVEKVAAGRQSDCEQAALDILALLDRASVGEGLANRLDIALNDPLRFWRDETEVPGLADITFGDLRALASAPDFFAENAKNSAPSPPVGGWRSMDSAPKDGTTFDAWAVCPRAPGHQVRFTDVQMRGDKSGFGVVLHRPEAQWEYLERDGGIYPEWRLTHWCPLPPPPEGDAL